MGIKAPADKRWRFVCTALLLTVGVPAAFAAAEGAETAGASKLDWFVLVSTMLGGLGLFLYGMEQMSDALKTLAGQRMKDILAKLTANRVMGMLTGAFVTSVIQSSSITTVLIIGFITAGLMTLPQAIGVILGADIGTTITAQIIAFKPTKYALLVIAVGVGIVLISKKKRLQQLGTFLLGFGLLFLGMNLMSDAMHPLRDFPTFLEIMARMANPVLGALAGAIFTALIQSSAAAIGVVILLASQGAISLEAGIALMLGANIGTCATAGLAAIGKPRVAKRAALAHVMFKVIGVAAILPFVGPLAELVAWISPKTELLGQEGLAAVTPRQVANAHTIFNVGIAFTFLPFAEQFAKLLMWMMPDRVEPAQAELQPQYLDPNLLDTPSVALGVVRREISRMADTLEEMLSGVPEAVFRPNLEKMAKITAMDDKVDALHEAVSDYLARIGAENLAAATADEALVLMAASTEFEAIGDIIENNLAHLAEVHANAEHQLDPDAIKTLDGFAQLAKRAFQTAVVAFVSDNKDAARVVMNLKDEVAEYDQHARAHFIQLLQSGSSPQEMSSYVLQTDIMENLKRIFYHTKRIAKAVLRDSDARASRRPDTA